MSTLEYKAPPRTIMEVFQMLPEGTLAELISASLYMSPSPTSFHQRVVRKLAFSLSEFIEKNNLGELFFAPFDVYLDEHSNVVQPDIVFVSKQKTHLIQRSGLHGAPDFVIEILSSGNSRHDKVIKKELYERFGIAEYWIVDPETKDTTGYVLKNGRYEEIKNTPAEINSTLFNHSFKY
jgi:Uma2 family endonuclease